MGDIFQEVDADLRQDRYRRLWRQYGRYIIGAAVLLVVATAANVAWKHYTTERRQSLGDRFVVAEQIEPPSAAADALRALAADGTEGYAMLARLRAADLKVAAGDRDGAVALYEEVAADGSVDPLYRDVAVLHSVIYKLDTAPAEETAARLQPLTAADNPWRYTARELLAAVALRGGDMAAARDRYTQIVDDPGAPASMRGRASEMLRAIGS